MTAASLDDENAFDEPALAAPVETRASRLGNRFTYDFPANSITFIRLGHP